MKKLLRFLLVVLLLFSIKSNALAISDTVAVLVDSLVFSEIDTGKYEVVIETLNGALLPSQELEIIEVDQQISNWNIEVPYFNENISVCNIKPNSPVVVRNLAGLQVFNGLSSDSRTEIDMGRLPHGIYLVSVVGKDNVRVIKKMVKN